MESKKRTILREEAPVFARFNKNVLSVFPAPAALAWGVLATLAGLCCSSHAYAQGYFSPGSEPSFTANQAARGKSVFGDNCASCHGGDLSGGTGPALTGSQFKTQWGSQTPGALMTYMATQMPPTEPGVLGPQAYADIEAYILQSNGVAAGQADLLPDIAAPQRPQQGGPEPSAQQEYRMGPPSYDATYKAIVAARDEELNRLKPVTDAMLADPPPGDWLTWRRTYNSLGYSPLKQINTSNASTLGVAWTWSLPVSPDEIEPLAYNGVVFIKSADTVEALDGATGTLLWRYTRSLPPSLHASAGIEKNLAIYQNNLYATTVDGHMIALDMKTGKLVWDHAVLGPKENDAHLRFDSGPLVAKGKVISGVSGCNTYKGGCFIVALDAQTGQEAWRFDTIARPGQPGGDSWNGAPVDQRFGGSVWTSGSYDPELNLVFFGVGQTYDTATLLEPQAKKGESNDALYTDSTLAIDPDNGKLVWYYQHMNRDVWDLDWVFEQSLITVPVDGQPRKALVTGGKIAIFDVVDRKTGKYLFSRDYGLQTLVSSVDPKTGKKMINPAFTPQPNKTMVICPHPGGARSWPATSYDPATGVLYAPLIESCMDFTYIPRDAQKTAEGGSDMHWVMIPRPDSDGKFGRVEAIDLKTGKVLWTDRRRAPEVSSILTTGGGLVFEGSRDRVFRASDEKDGKELWQTRLNAPPSSSPISYTADGQQYIAVVAGGGGADEATWPPLTPEIKNPAGGTTLWVFKLPSQTSTADSGQ